MLHELDRTLEALLKQELPSFGGNEISVSFAAPDAQFAVRLPAIDLFLYDLRENLELRGNDDQLTPSADGLQASRGRPPVRIDASYLITAWPGGGQEDAPQDEHRLLGAVMTTLLRHRKLPRDFLFGQLSNQQLPLPVTMLQPGRLQSLGEFWQALGGKPKVALNYTVTFAVDVLAPVVSSLVTEKEFRIGELARKQVAA